MREILKVLVGSQAHGLATPERKIGMPSLIIMRGLPASGKTTKAEEIARDNGNCVRLNKDLLRKMLHFDKFTDKNEAMTNAAEMALARMFLESNKNVIIDDTNLNTKVFQKWESLAGELDLEFHVFPINTPIWECVRRDKIRNNSVGQDVIINMARKNGLYFSSRKDIICDIDGTLCDISDRVHLVKGTEKKDWDAFFANIPNDKPRWEIINQIKALDHFFNIVLVSGRPEDYKKETIEWLKKHEVPYETLIMRRTNDKRDDTVIKKEILDTYFKIENIQSVFDDRPRVIKMWKENGLDVIDVGDGVEF